MVGIFPESANSGLQLSSKVRLIFEDLCSSCQIECLTHAYMSTKYTLEDDFTSENKYQQYDLALELECCFHLLVFLYTHFTSTKQDVLSQE